LRGKTNKYSLPLLDTQLLKEGYRIGLAFKVASGGVDVVLEKNSEIFRMTFGNRKTKKIWNKASYY